MDTGTYFYLAVLGVFAAVVLLVTAKTGRFAKSFFLSALSGIGALLAVNLITNITAVSIPINPISLAVSVIFGISGVIGLVVTQLV